MIRVRPLGMALAILFMVLGPHTSWIAGSKPAPQAPSTPVSWILPDQANVSDRPTHGDIDAVQTKQGWKVRFPSKGQFIGGWLVLAVVFAFYWPLRKKALARK